MRKKNSGVAYKLPNEQFIKIVSESTSGNEAMREIGFKCVSGNARKTFYRRIIELNINVDHWGDKTKNMHRAVLTPHDQYFAKDTPHSGGHIRRRIIKYNLINYECALCKNTGIWMGKELILQIDHINGDHNDNRLENLRFLCPNCHSQTDTFAGKNVKY